MLMDDTVILATTRERCKEKVKTLLDYCGEYGMIINEKKTKFMVIGKHVGTIGPLVVTSSDQNHICKIEHCESYTYLGCIFTNDGRTRTAIKSHVEDKKKHLLKLIMFFAKNQDMPFSVKLKILNACFLSTILYGCESWLNVSLKPVEKLYFGSIKALLGVRSTTCNNLCLLELGMPSLQDYVNQKQRDFFQKLNNERVGRQDDPFLLSFQFMEENNNFLASYIEKLLERKNDIPQEFWWSWDPVA